MSQSHYFHGQVSRECSVSSHGYSSCLWESKLIASTTLLPFRSLTTSFLPLLISILSSLPMKSLPLLAAYRLAMWR